MSSGSSKFFPGGTSGVPFLASLFYVDSLGRGSAINGVVGLSFYSSG